MAFTRTWDGTYEAAITDNSYMYEVDNYIRELMVDIRERLSVEHKWAGDEYDGQHTAAFIASVKKFSTKYIAGLGLSLAADTEHDITVAIGGARDSTDAQDIALATAITKQADATWAVGSAAGGMTSACHPMIASTVYNIFLILRSDTGVVDVCFDTSESCANIPANYDYFRWIGFFTTDASANIVACKWLGSGANLELWFDAATAVVTGLTTTTYAAQSLSAFIPATLTCLAWLNAIPKSTNYGYYMLSSDGTNARATGLSYLNAAVGDFQELGAHNAEPAFIPVISNQIYFKRTTDYTGTNYTLNIHAVKFWR